MAGMYLIKPIKVNGILMVSFMCDKCRKTFAYVHNEPLYCPHCKERGYPLNADPDKGESEQNWVSVK